MASDSRDVLGIYIPRRISTLSDADILLEIEALQARREAILSALSKEKKASTAKTKSGTRKSKAEDLTKVEESDAYIAIAAQMGITVDELKRLASTK